MKDKIDSLQRKVEKLEWLFAILLFFVLTMTVLTYLPRVIEWEDQNGVFSTIDTQTVTVERLPK